MTEQLGQVHSDGVTIAVRHRLTGGAPVLLIHALGSDAIATWRATGWLHALQAGGYGWIAPDLRGHGASDRLYDPGDYRPALLAADMVAVLDDVGVARADVVGYSLGSRVAAELAVIQPDRVRTLVLGGFGDRPSPPSGESIEQLIARLPPGADVAAVRACASANLDRAARAALERIRASVLLVAGDADEFAGDVRAAAARCRDARVEGILGRTHYNALSSADFKRVALEFIEQVGVTSASDPAPITDR